MPTHVRICLLLTSLLLLVSGLGASANSVMVSRVGREEPGRALVIWDDLRVADVSPVPPGTPEKTLARARCGDILLTLGEYRRGRLRVQLDGVTGWAFANGVVDLSDPAADARLLAAAFDFESPGHWARDPNYGAAIALYSRHLELFPESQYRPLARYRFGQVADCLAVEATKAIRQAESAERADSSRGDEARLEAVESEQLRKYERWGLVLKRSHLGGQCYYGGEAYRAVLAEYPQSQYADEASYQLLKLEREEVGEWEGHPEGPFEELRHWQAFLERYPGSDLRPKALLQVLYLQRVLYEIYLQSPTAEVRDESAAREHGEAAQELARRIMREYPGTRYAAEAETGLSELQHGEHVYILGAPE